MKLFEFFSRVLTTHRNCRGCCRKDLCHFCLKSPAPFSAFHREDHLRGVKVFLCAHHYIFIQTCQFAPAFIPESPPTYAELKVTLEQIQSEVFKHEMFAGLK